LAGFVLGKNPANIESAINDARVPEMSLGEATEDDAGFLSQQVTEMRRDLQKLVQRYDSIAISAFIQRKRLKSPAPRVTFQDPQRRSNVAEVMQCYKPLEVAVREDLDDHVDAAEVIRYCRQSGAVVAKIFAETLGENFNPSRVTRRSKKRLSLDSIIIPPNLPNMGQREKAKCGKCGNNRHSNVLYCLANN